MEEKTIFRVHDENEWHQPDSVETEKVKKEVKSTRHTDENVNKPVRNNKSDNGKSRKKKGLMSQFSAAGKVAFILGLILIVASVGVIGATEIPSLINGKSSNNNNTPSNNAPSNNNSGTAENVVTVQDATVLQLTADAGDEYMDDVLFIGDSNYNRMYMLGLLDLDHVIGVDGMGVQSVPGSNAVYFVEKANPVTIPEAVKIMQPKTIIMNFGTNNLVAATADSFIENYEEAIDAIEKAYPYADIIIQSIPPVGSDLPSGYRMVDYKKVYTFNNALIKMCEERGLHYLNVTEDVWRSSDGHCKSEYITSDGIHLEQVAYEKLLSYVCTHALLTDDTRPELTEKLTRKPAPVVVYQYQCDVVVTSAMESFYDAGYIDFKKVKEGEKEENYKEADTYKFTIPEEDATKGSEEDMGQALFQSVNSQVKNKEKAQVGISYKASEDGGYVFTISVKEVCNHDYKTESETVATCEHGGTKILICKICGKKSVVNTDKLEHDLDWTTATNYDSAKKTVSVKCKLCEEYITVDHGDSDHELGEGTITTQPTCTAKGVKTAKCSICGQDITVEVEALGHDYTVFVSDTTAATCDKAGKATYKCSRCDSTVEKDTQALGHDYTVFVSEDVPATCEGVGKATYKCSRCESTTQVDIPALGHSFVNGVCSRCGASDPNYVAPENPGGSTDSGNNGG